ncbi:MAG: hypothetical protein KC800_24435, partial [Candidatus Eremiobacteraeota bacterium]|nr:hypothetical protein [Candidatus Eremiobacteraeota bacterium]
DFYLSRDHISRDPYLPYVTAVVAHSQRLARCLQDFHERVFYLDHDCRYLLPKMQPYRTEGPLLWVGYTGNLPYLARWLSEHSLPSQLMVLTDQPGRVPLPDAVQEIWTPRRQQEYLRFARAALDIKGVSFNQEMRPPEKLEMFLSNGIPSACNPESSLFNHFREDGFQIVDPADHTRWFSAEYHEETCAYAKVLRRRLDVGTVGKRMRSILETLL